MSRFVENSSPSFTMQLILIIHFNLEMPLGDVAKIFTMASQVAEAASEINSLVTRPSRNSNVIYFNNTSEDNIQFQSYYINKGHCFQPMKETITAKDKDIMTFVQRGILGSGCSGIIQWELPNPTTYLFFMWKAPFNHHFQDNYYGMWINETSLGKEVSIIILLE